VTNVVIATEAPATDASAAYSSPGFVDRRKGDPSGRGMERRQFGNSYRHLSEAGQELAEAIDAYKLQNRRRYVTTDEMLEVIYSLGYRKS
jgi:hypothetical protein